MDDRNGLFDGFSFNYINDYQSRGEYYDYSRNHNVGKIHKDEYEEITKEIEELM